MTLSERQDYLQVTEAWRDPTEVKQAEQVAEFFFNTILGQIRTRNLPPTSPNYWDELETDIPESIAEDQIEEWRKAPDLAYSIIDKVYRGFFTSTDKYNIYAREILREYLGMPQGGGIWYFVNARTEEVIVLHHHSLVVKSCNE